MIKMVAGKSVFTVTDACMNAALKKITLTYNGETIEVPMPQGEFAVGRHRMNCLNGADGMPCFNECYITIILRTMKHIKFITFF